MSGEQGGRTNVQSAILNYPELKYESSSPMDLMGFERLERLETTPRLTSTFRSLPSHSREMSYRGPRSTSAGKTSKAGNHVRLLWRLLPSPPLAPHQPVPVMTVAAHLENLERRAAAALSRAAATTLRP